MAKKKTVKKEMNLSKKILILTASPQRDKVIDELIAEELQKMGHQVWVIPCLREGRSTNKIFDIQPNLVVVPPIRNVLSRDMVECLNKWGCGVISRHTEPSCDWQDFKAMVPGQKQNILGRFQYFANLELVWSEDEAQILTKRNAGFPTMAVGAFALDIYFRKDFRSRFMPRQSFNQKYKFDQRKKNLIIQSPWGFADSAPDLNIDETGEAKKDIEGRNRHLGMIQFLYQQLSKQFNILVTIHPGVLEEPYKKILNQLKIPLDNESSATELLVNSDVLVHAGSTTAIEAHCLGVPAFQFGDVNYKGSKHWWGRAKSSISHVSPYYKDIAKLAIDISKAKPLSNANKASIKKLEQGRYGKMDGKATIRAAELISKIDGKFQMCWPDSTRDYTQLTIQRSPFAILQPVPCNVCKKEFYLLKDEWLVQLSNFLKLPGPIKPKYDTCCPHCGAKFVKNEPRKEDNSDYTSTAGKPATAQQSPAGTTA